MPCLPGEGRSSVGTQLQKYQVSTHSYWPTYPQNILSSVTSSAVEVAFSCMQFPNLFLLSQPWVEYVGPVAPQSAAVEMSHPVV